jgi:hypothetical protein
MGTIALVKLGLLSKHTKAVPDIYVPLRIANVTKAQSLVEFRQR